jgi:vacuolar-type H+-ATPase catalytic subunit A/Vma1
MMPTFHYTDPEVFFENRTSLTVGEVRKLLNAMEHCTSSRYYNEWFSKAMYELCPESYDTVQEYLREWSEREIKAQEVMPQTNQKKLEPCEEFASSVACLIAEGSEFMTKEQLYDAIKNAFNRIILKQGERND